jgi:GrpB-like predicted nucleotidyltransferase (UPF0157 family)
MNIILEPHSPAWHAKFCQVQHDLKDILKDIPLLAIEHIGSTSIPSLIAKPVLDIDIIVTPETLASTRQALVAAGYEDLGEMGVPGRVAFRQPGFTRSEVANGYFLNPHGEIEMRRNTYVILEGSSSLRNHQSLKRVLLEDEGLRTEYGETKKKIVESGVDNVDEYCRGKNEVMLKILKMDGWTEDELEEVRIVNA